MVQIKNNGGLTVARRVKRNGNTQGIMRRDNLTDAAMRGSGNVVLNKKIK